MTSLSRYPAFLAFAICISGCNGSNSSGAISDDWLTTCTPGVPQVCTVHVGTPKPTEIDSDLDGIADSADDFPRDPLRYWDIGILGYWDIEDTGILGFWVNSDASSYISVEKNSDIDVKLKTYDVSSSNCFNEKTIFIRREVGSRRIDSSYEYFVNGDRKYLALYVLYLDSYASDVLSLKYVPRPTTNFLGMKRYTPTIGISVADLQSCR